MVNQERLAGICARNVLYFGADRERERDWGSCRHWRAYGVVSWAPRSCEHSLQSRPEISEEDGPETRLSHAPTTGTNRALTSSQAHPMIGT